MTSDNGPLLDITRSSSDNSTAQVATTTTLGPITLQELVGAARDFASEAKSSNTRRAYRRDWKAFEAWCRLSGFTSLPAEPPIVAMYISSLATTGKRVASISRVLVSISQVHKMAGYPSPTSSAQVLEIMKGIRRTLGSAQTQKSPVEARNIKAMVEELGEDLLDTRDRALLLVGFAGAFRRSELIGPNVADVEFTNDGLVITLQRSKTDQEGQGRKVGIPFGGSPLTCPVRALRAWLAAAKVNEGPVFRAVGRWDHVGIRRLNDRAVARAVKKYTSLIGLDSSCYSGHSLRSGFATSAARAGKSERSIMNQTGHRSVAMVRRYIRSGSLFLDNAAAGLL